MSDGEWQVYWNKLLKEKKLALRIAELNIVDHEKNESNCLTETICKKVFDGYAEMNTRLEGTRKKFLAIIDEFQGVHLQSSRIKTKDSLICKIIRKRYENINSKLSPYAVLNEDNYENIITDLIGMRLIINYRGKWNIIHEEIVKAFPIIDKADYEHQNLLPHTVGNSFQAEIPTAYYAEGDNPQSYKACGLRAKVHKKGYRSIHYTVGFEDTYIELQVRTIYDEAWSDCDHQYVYKQEANPSNYALIKLSEILCGLTNTANDMGDTMREIFEGRWLIDTDTKEWITTKECLCAFDQSIKKLDETSKKLREFREQLTD